MNPNESRSSTSIPQSNDHTMSPMEIESNIQINTNNMIDKDIEPDIDKHMHFDKDNQYTNTQLTNEENEQQEISFMHPLEPFESNQTIQCIHVN
jgi:hypothetical protein